MSASKPVILTFDLRSQMCYFFRSSWGLYNLERQFDIHIYWRNIALQFAPGANLS